MNKTKIQWTEATWNPVRGCSRVSRGCEHCYAETMAARFSKPGMPYHGLAVMTPSGPRWTGEVRLVPERLGDPLRWKKPRRIFVNSMSDLFHEKLTNEEIAAVFGVMAAAPQHTFQVLTKRPERMREWFRWVTLQENPLGKFRHPMAVALQAATDRLNRNFMALTAWPLPNVWLGVSVEDQATADERIPLLLETPAAIRFVSFEPALGPVDFTGVKRADGWTIDALLGVYERARGGAGAFDDEPHAGVEGHGGGPRLDWLIVGGESGPCARPFDLAWARSAIAQCKAAQVPCFVKQLGARPIFESENEDRERRLCPLPLKDRKGGDPSEWPADLRVREFPEVRA